MINRLLRQGLLALTVVGLCGGCGPLGPLGPEDIPYTPLEKAILRDDLEGVQRLLDEGADPTEATPDNGPLDIAVARGNVQVVKLLIDSGAAQAPPHNSSGSYFVYVALRGGASTNDANDFAVAQLLVDAGLDPCARMTDPEWNGLLPSEVADKDGRHDLAADLRGLEVDCDSG